MSTQGAGYVQRLGRMLGTLSDHEISRLLTAMAERELRSQELVYAEGENSDSIYFVVRGCVRLFVAGRNDREVVLELLRVGDILGETALIEEGVRQSSAQATEPSTIVGLRREAFEALMLQYPTLAAAVTKLLARRILAQQQLMQRLASLPVSGRLALLLLEELVRQGTGEVLQLGLRHHQIAQLIGTSRETVSALLRRFAQLGLIKYDRTVIRVLDQEQLGRCARGELYVSAR